MLHIRTASYLRRRNETSFAVFPRMTSTMRAVASPPYLCLSPSSCHQHQVLPRRIVSLPDRVIDLLSQSHNLHSGVPAWRCIQHSLINWRLSSHISQAQFYFSMSTGLESLSRLMYPQQALRGYPRPHDPQYPGSSPPTSALSDASAPDGQARTTCHYASTIRSSTHTATARFAHATRSRVATERQS